MENHLNVVMATDFSEKVRNAERYAFQFAAYTKSRIMLLHVYPVPVAVPLLNRELRIHERGLAELESVKRHGNVLMTHIGILPGDMKYECKVREGAAGEEVCREAQESGVHLIFTGTHSADGLFRLFSTSHTWEVIRLASCPVLTIPEDGFFTGVKQLTYVTEYRKNELPVIRFVFKLAESFGAGLLILHMGNFGYSRHLETMMFERFRDELRQNLDSNKPDIRLLHRADVVSGLNDFCLHTYTDWLVISRGTSSLLDQLFNPGMNLSRELSFKTRLPLLTVPDAYNWEESGTWTRLKTFQENEKTG